LPFIDVEISDYRLNISDHRLTPSWQKLQSVPVIGLFSTAKPSPHVGPTAALPASVRPQELRDRLALFAAAVEAFSRPLLSAIETRDAAVQLRRASSSTAANHRAAGRGRSHAEFVSKLGIALEEADESLFWLEHLQDCHLAPEPEIKGLIQESHELVAILTASARTAKSRRNR